MNRLIIGLLGLVLPNILMATGADDIVGVWLAKNYDGYIYIHKKADKYQGVIVGSPTLEPQYDTENPDPALNGRLMLDIVLLWDFVYKKENFWTGGRIYEPNHGRDYAANIRLADDGSLKLRGYVATPLLGRTDTWTKMGDDPDKFRPPPELVDQARAAEPRKNKTE